MNNEYAPCNDVHKTPNSTWNHQTTQILPPKHMMLCPLLLLMKELNKKANNIHATALDMLAQMRSIEEYIWAAYEPHRTTTPNDPTALNHVSPIMSDAEQTSQALYPVPSNAIDCTQPFGSTPIIAHTAHIDRTHRSMHDMIHICNTDTHEVLSSTIVQSTTNTETSQATFTAFAINPVQLQLNLPVGSIWCWMWWFVNDIIWFVGVWVGMSLPRVCVGGVNSKCMMGVY